MNVIINSEGLSINCKNWILELFDIIIIIGVNLSEPHINGTAVREMYAQYGSMDIAKCKIFYCAFSYLGHRPYASMLF